MTTLRRSISRVPSGNWRARYIDPDTGKWVAAGTHRTKSLATAAIDQAVSAVITGTHVRAERATMTFERYADDLFWPMEDLEVSTHASHRCLYKNHVLPRWGHVLLGDITIEAVERWSRVELPARTTLDGARPLAVATRGSIYWIFHKIIAKAVERSYIAHSPLPRKSGLPVVQSTKPERILTPDEIDALADAVGNRALIFAMAYGGFRIGEAFALRLEDIDFDAGVVTVDEQFTKRGTTMVLSNNLKRQRSQRTVPLPSLVIEMLAVQTMGMTDPRAFVFPNPQGKPMNPDNWRDRVFHAAVRAAGLPHMVPHDLRHTAASQWFDEGTDIVTVARLLGDSLAVAERTYVHFYTDRHEALTRALDERVRTGQTAGARLRLVPAPDQAAMAAGS